MKLPGRRPVDRVLRDAFLIAGPTASGKSAQAIALAERTGGIIVNADSMQVYSVLRVLTARPDDTDRARAPHRLYGHVHPARPYSTGAWMRDVRDLIEAGTFDEHPAIFTGGTGLYFRALLDGLSEIPAIPDPVRNRLRARLAEEGAPPLHRVLAERDPQAAAAIREGDGQRIVRALEVLEASGKPIGYWQKQAGPPLVDRASAQCFVIEPDRAALVERIEHRFDRMIEAGALDEVRALLALDLPPSMPAMKAIGVRELAAALAGELSLDEAIGRAKIATRQYSKRQSTWFRNQLGAEWKRVAALPEEV